MKIILPNEMNRILLPGFVAFCVASLGVALSFVSHSVNSNILGKVAFAITVMGVIGGFVSVAYMMFRMFSGNGVTKIQNGYMQNNKRSRQPWE